MRGSRAFVDPQRPLLTLRGSREVEFMRVGMAIVVAAVIYTGEWLLSVPAGDTLVDATLGGFVSLLILGWWRG